MARINRLSTRLSNQIAAGEVVERPASVVKELLENSLDAGAGRLDVEVEQGGVKLIRVRDDGCGVEQDDLPLTIARHATSKIHDLDDLEGVATLGFRGEALASISSVSRLSLTSSADHSGAGWSVQAEGRDMDAVIVPAAHPRGTSVEVRDLFFNTPARRKFLRTEKTEFSHLEEVIKRLALSHFEVGFSLRHNQRSVHALKPAGSEAEQDRRVAALCGPTFIENAVRVDTQLGELRLWGWLGLPTFSRSQADLQYFFVNGRSVKDKVVNHAVRQAYKDVMYHGRHAAFVLYLELDPKGVDVNVHPTKAEVRFEDASVIFSAVQRAVRDVIIGYSQPSLANRRQHSDYNRDWQDEPRLRASQLDFDFDVSDPANQPFEYGGQSQSSVEEGEDQPQRVRTLPVLRVLGQIGAAYIVTEGPAGMYLIDQHGAHQRILYESFKAVLDEADTLVTQPIDTQTIDVSVAENQAIQAHDEMLKRLGFELESFGINTYALRSVPVELAHGDVISGLAHLLEKLQERIDFDTLLMHLADIVAVKRGVILSQDDMQSLIRELEYTPSPKFDAFGDTVILHFSSEQIARQFRT